MDNLWTKDTIHHGVLYLCCPWYHTRYCRKEISPSLFWLGQYLDILAISCDSFCEDTNCTIGRRQGNKNHLTSLKAVREWCSQYKVAFKINTVVNTHNLEENMANEIVELSPIRWKVSESKSMQPPILTWTWEPVWFFLIDINRDACQVQLYICSYRSSNAF